MNASAFWDQPWRPIDAFPPPAGPHVRGQMIGARVQEVAGHLDRHGDFVTTEGHVPLEFAFTHWRPYFLDSVWPLP